MTITQVPHAWIKYTFLIGFIAALTACGGGGSGSPKPPITPPDTTPDAFSFAPVTDVEPGSVQTSAPITVSGINTGTPISITGGQYAIGTGAFTSAAGTVTVGQIVAVRVTAPAGTEQNAVAELTIGGVEGTFSVTTFADTQAPIAEFMFPPPMTMSEANSVIVRGTTTDYNQIARVQIQVNDSETLIDVTPAAEGDYSSWTATVPLTTGVDNQIVVVTEDEFENVSDSESAAKVVIRQDSTYRAAFPDEDYPFTYVGSIGLDQLNGRNRLLVMTDQVISIDIATGKRTPFIDLDHENLAGFFGAAIDPARGEIYFTNSYAPIGTLIKVNLADPSQYELYSDSLYRFARFSILNTIGDLKIVSLRSDSSSAGSIVETIVSTGHVSVLSDAALSIPDASNPFVSPTSIVHDVERNRYLVADSSSVAIFSVDENTGERTIFSSNSVGSGPNYGDSSQSSQLGTIALNTRTQQALVLEGRTGKVFSIDLVTATRNVISTTPFTGIVNPGIIFSGVAVDESCNCLYYSHRSPKAIVTVDLSTGQQLILSKSAH